MTHELHQQRGAVMVTFAIALTCLLLFCGLAIDVGLLYATRGALAKGTDAAALMGVRSLEKGHDVATAVAQSSFAMNYLSSNVPGLQVSYPAVTVSYSTDGTGNERLTVNSAVRVRTFFLGLLPGRDIMDVNAVAQAARAHLIMGLALDRSGSMGSNGGSTALSPAVQTFINFFDEANDHVGMSSFADSATLDVPITHTFKTAITSKLKAMKFSGWTGSHLSIDIERGQIKSVPTLPTENVIRAVVFFTDGYANTFLSNVNCQGSTIPLIIVPGSNTDDFRNPNTGATVTCKSTTTKTFYSDKYKTNRTRNAANCTEEGQYRAEQSAALARADGTLVFSIGLGSDIDKAILLKMANDPASASFNPAQPQGVAAFAPTAADLDDVFRQIAAKILLRLTR